MNCGQATHDRVIVDPNVAGERAVVRKDNSVPNDAIVPDMAIGEKISAVGNLCFPIALGAAIHGHELAKDIFIANLQIGWLAGILEVLGLVPDRAIGVKFVPGPDPHRAHQRDVML